MFDIILAGVGGQGTVLAAKVLAQAAANQGWHVRTAETIGMAQRGGSVVSHVRLGNDGEDIAAPLVTEGTADLLIAFEPGEAARNLHYLAPGAKLVTATSAIEPVSAALGSVRYEPSELLENIRAALGGSDSFESATTDGRMFVVDDGAIIESIGGNRKVLNTVLLAAAFANGCIPLKPEDLAKAIETAVKPKFVQLNLDAIEATNERYI